MSTTHDTSVLFSINQLMNDYETRVLEEQAEAARKAEAEERARQEALRLAKEEEARKAHEETMRRIREEAAQREEAARLEAIRLAAIERARIEAERHAQIELQKREQEHALALEALREDEKKKKLERSIRLGAVAGVLAIAGVLGLYFGKIKPDHEAHLAAQAANINSQFDETRRLEAQNAANQKRIKQAEDALAKSKEQAEAAAAQPATTSTVKKPQSNGTGIAKPQTKSGSCLPGEPGCDFNGNRIF
jgi:colicin import membrane protein